ncbi:ATP-binding protein [Azospirillum sp. TSH100]|nr:ATP-binding protein [Azospirillum sp. TSH100]
MLGPRELYERADEHLIDRLVENSSVEKKSGRYNKSALSEYFSMWANTAPDGGLIIVGVENDGTKTGLLSLSEKQIAEIELAGPHLCADARYDRKKISIINHKGQDDYVLLFYVKYNENRVVENHKHDAFIRRGDEKRKLSELEKSELRIDKGEVDFEAEPCGLPYPDDFRVSDIADFCQNVRSGMPGMAERTDEEILQLRRLGSIRDGKFRPNNACALLFANDPQSRFPGCKLRILRFDGDVEGTGSKFNATKDIWIEGTIPEIITHSKTAIRAQIREFTRLGPDGKFFTGPEYPEDAWYEAVVNACAHRSFNMRNVNIFVKMFDDRLEIESPGGFPPGITPENIYNHSIPRNRRLFEAMFFLRYVLCSNEGTRRMRDRMLEFGLPAPQFKQSDVDGIKVRVVLQNNISFRKQYIDKRAIDIIGHPVFSALNKKERMIVNYTVEHNQITVSDASRIVKGGWRQIKKMLDSLVSRDVMERISPMGIERDPKAHYVLKKGKHEKTPE